MKYGLSMRAVGSGKHRVFLFHYGNSKRSDSGERWNILEDLQGNLRILESIAYIEGLYNT